jgi:hypothetical protein
LIRVKNLHEEDLQQGYGAVYLPDALERKYLNANREWGWQYVFPSQQLSVDPRSGVTRRHHAKDVSTTMIYTHVLNRGGRGVTSPLDQL